MLRGARHVPSIPPSSSGAFPRHPVTVAVSFLLRPAGSPPLGVSPNPVLGERGPSSVRTATGKPAREPLATLLVREPEVAGRMV